VNSTISYNRAQQSLLSYSNARTYSYMRVVCIGRYESFCTGTLAVISCSFQLAALRCYHCYCCCCCFCCCLHSFTASPDAFSRVGFHAKLLVLRLPLLLASLLLLLHCCCCCLPLLLLQLLIVLFATILFHLIPLHQCRCLSLRAPLLCVCFLTVISRMHRSGLVMQLKQCASSS
jgi:hypothetical protein